MGDKKSHFHLFEESFPGLEDNIIRCEKLGYPWLSKPFLKEDYGEPVSHVGLMDYPLVIEGREYKVAALHAICTKVSHRGRGLASELIREALQWAKSRYEYVVLFTEIPKFYEKLTFHAVQEYRFHLTRRCPKGKQTALPIISPKDNALLLRIFRERAPASDHIWMKDNGSIASFNTLFATFPTYWSLHYSSSIDGIISYEIKERTLHLYDIIAAKIPSLELILDHMPEAIDEIYFYFSPDRLSKDAIPHPYLFDHGNFMVHGKWPSVKPFMISPISRC